MFIKQSMWLCWFFIYCKVQLFSFTNYNTRCRMSSIFSSSSPLYYFEEQNTENLSVHVLLLKVHNDKSVHSEQTTETNQDYQQTAPSHTPSQYKPIQPLPIHAPLTPRVSSHTCHCNMGCPNDSSLQTLERSAGHG